MAFRTACRRKWANQPGLPVSGGLPCQGVQVHQHLGQLGPLDGAGGVEPAAAAGAAAPQARDRASSRAHPFRFTADFTFPYHFGTHRGAPAGAPLLRLWPDPARSATGPAGIMVAEALRGCKHSRRDIEKDLKKQCRLWPIWTSQIRPTFKQDQRLHCFLHFHGEVRRGTPAQ